MNFRSQVYSLLLVGPLVAVMTIPLQSATLKIADSALQKLLDAETKDGKIPLGPQDDCNNPYVENLHIATREGRLHIDGHVSGHVGGRVAGLCVAAADPSNFTISAVPLAAGSTVKLTNLTLDQIEKPHLSPVIGFIINLVSAALQIDLKTAADAALKKSAPYAITLDSLDVHMVTPATGAIFVDFDFKLSIQ